MCIGTTHNDHLVVSIVVQNLIQTDAHTHTHPFNNPFSGITRVSRYQKGKKNLDFTEARDSEWQWHQLGRMQVCTSLQTDNHASTPPPQFFTGRMPFLPPNQQHQSTEGSNFNNVKLSTFCPFGLKMPIHALKISVLGKGISLP